MNSPCIESSFTNGVNFIRRLRRAVVGVFLVAMTGLSLASMMWTPFAESDAALAVNAAARPNTAPATLPARDAVGHSRGKDLSLSPASVPARTGGRAGGKPIIQILSQDDQVRVVKHAAGTTRVPLHPQRIIAIDYADELVALGIEPFAVMSGRSAALVPDYLMAQLPHALAVPSGHLYDVLPALDYIASYEPDLILVSVRDLHTFEQYSAIAPTVSLATGGGSRIISADSDLPSLKRRLMDVASVVGREEQARRYISFFDQRLTTARATWARIFRGRTVAVFRMRWQRWCLYGKDDAPSGLFDLLQIKMPAAGHGLAKPLDLEDLMSVKADYIVLADDDTIGAPQELARLEKSSIWRNMPAVKAGRVLHRHIVCNYWLGGGLIAKSRMLADLQELSHTGAPLAMPPDDASSDDQY